MEADWDLFAIVRGSSRGGVSTADPRPLDGDNPLVSSDDKSLDDSLFSFNMGFPDEFFFGSSSNGTLDELFPLPPKDELCDLSSSTSSAASSVCPLAGRILSSNFQPQNTTTIPKSPAFKRRRKNQLKKVQQVPSDSLISSDDTWSWRKYGQKPIKGSPYPRGYYKCSTLKGCPARKQVERNRANADMFIVTYTAEHNHPAPTSQRNSLAGTTRSNQNQKKGKNVIVNSRSRELEELKEGVGRLSSSEEEGEMMMRMIGGDVDGGGGGGECRWSVEMEDDFFDGLDGELENVGIGYW